MELKWSDVQQQFYTQLAEERAKARADSKLENLSVDSESSMSESGDVSRLVGEKNALQFADFAEPTAVSRVYQQVPSDSQLSLVLTHYLREYNSVNYKYVGGQ
jgi:hypothetical protein